MATTQAQFMRQITGQRLEQAAAGTLEAEAMAYLITSLRWAFSKKQAVALLAEHPAAHRAVLAGLSSPEVEGFRADIITYVALAKGVK